jgi:hypothetical protein
LLSQVAVVAAHIAAVEVVLVGLEQAHHYL